MEERNMGCDHLEVARFKKSMGNLQDNHSRIADIYRKNNQLHVDFRLIAC